MSAFPSLRGRAKDTTRSALPAVHLVRCRRRGKGANSVGTSLPTGSVASHLLLPSPLPFLYILWSQAASKRMDRPERHEIPHQAEEENMILHISMAMALAL